MTEQLTALEPVEHALVRDDLDRPAAYHPQVLHGLRALGEDDCARQVELDLRGRGDLLEIAPIDRVERGVRTEEVNDIREYWDAFSATALGDGPGQHTRGRLHRIGARQPVGGRPGGSARSPPRTAIWALAPRGHGPPAAGHDLMRTRRSSRAAC